MQNMIFTFQKKGKNKKALQYYFSHSSEASCALLTHYPRWRQHSVFISYCSCKKLPETSGLAKRTMVDARAGGRREGEMEMLAQGTILVKQGE
jgi:hypothetical protein